MREKPRKAGYLHVRHQGIAVEIGKAIEAIKKEGKRHGFDVMSEFPVIFWDTHEHGRIDVAWFKKGERVPAAVFEVEGSNVQKPSLRKDIKKFHWAECAINVVVLYSHRRGRMLVERRATALNHIGKHISHIQSALAANMDIKLFIDDGDFNSNLEGVARDILRDA